MDDRVFKVRKCAGDSGYAVYEEFTFPGKWYFNRITSIHSEGPFQNPPEKYFLFVGFSLDSHA